MAELEPRAQTYLVHSVCKCPAGTGGDGGGGGDGGTGSKKQVAAGRDEKLALGGMAGGKARRVRSRQERWSRGAARQSPSERESSKLQAGRCARGTAGKDGRLAKKWRQWRSDDWMILAVNPPTAEKKIRPWSDL